MLYHKVNFKNNKNDLKISYSKNERHEKNIIKTII